MCPSLFPQMPAQQYKQWKPKTIKNYHRIIPDPEDQDRYCIFIELGPFAGITVAFGRFQMADKDNDDGTTKARYEYEMIGIPPDFKDKEFTDEEGEEFEYMLGQIYINILNEELEKQKEESEDGTTRKYDFNKPIA